jgi:adenylate kinase
VRFVLVGPPGAGKGTQATVVSTRLGVPHISTGDLFRHNVGQSTPLGLEAKQYMDAGQLVPDSVTNAMVADRLSQDDVEPGFLLDGYPRNPAQVDVLDELLVQRGVALDAVVELVVDRDEITGRLLERARQQGRADDTAEVIAARFDVYDAETAPVVAVYRERGLLRVVDGLGAVPDVTARVLAALEVSA